MKKGQLYDVICIIKYLYKPSTRTHLLWHNVKKCMYWQDLTWAEFSTLDVTVHAMRMQ
jgi:hypothetical protein